MADLYQATYDAVRSKISGGDIGAAVEAAANLQLGGFSFLPQHAQQEIYRVSEEYTRPSVLFKPTLQPDGTAWCALYGADLAVGVAGFGDTPEAAMRAFDEAWLKSKTPAADQRAAGQRECL